MRIAAHSILGFATLTIVAGFVWTQAAETWLWPNVSPGKGTSLGRPSMEIDKAVWNFGSVPIGEELQATFSISNHGSRRLILLDQSQCCGSTEQDVIIPPGQTKNVDFRVTTRGRSLGPHRQVVCYETNDGDNPTLVLTIEFELTEH